MTIKKIKDSSGIEHGIDYEALENKPIANYEYKTLDLSNSSLGPQSSMEVDLSDYLPNDGCNYLVSVSLLAGCASTTGVNAHGYTDIATNPFSYCFFRLSSGANNTYEGGTCQMLVGPGRKIYLYNAASGTMTDIYVTLAHYMKVS